VIGTRIARLSSWNGLLTNGLGLALALAAGLLLVRLAPASGVLFVALTAVVVATLGEPLVGLAAALFLGLLRAYLHTEVPQVPAQVAHVFLALTLAVWLARGLARRRLLLPHPPLLLPLCLFIGTALLSLWDADGLVTFGLPELLKWVQILLLFLFVSDHLTVRRLPWLLAALLVTGLFQSAVGAWQFGLRGDGPDHFLIPGTDFYRAYGSFEQPNPYAGYLGLTLPLALGATWGVVGSWWKSRRGGKTGDHDQRALVPRLLLPLVPFVAMLAALGMSWSRGAWIGFGAALCAMVIALPRRARWGLLLAAVLVAGGLALYTSGILPPSITTRLTDFAAGLRLEDVRGIGIDDANYAVIERLAHWQSALEMLRHNLWTGVGFGCYEAAYPDFALINWPVALGHAHNYYFNIAAETGLLGLAAYLVLWGAVFWKTWQATRRAEGLLRGLAIGLLGTWTHLSVHHLLDNLYVNNVHLHIGVLLGLLAFILKQAQGFTRRS
jgi:putative inorganic carbon (HCO3(-)) transporter